MKTFKILKKHAKEVVDGMAEDLGVEVCLLSEAIEISDARGCGQIIFVYDLLRAIRDARFNFIEMMKHNTSKKRHIKRIEKLRDDVVKELNLLLVEFRKIK